MENIDEEIGLKHPIVFDAYDLCDYHKRGKLEAFNVAMLKTILRHFELSSFLSKRLRGGPNSVSLKK